jgi:hypothetical protein
MGMDEPAPARSSREGTIGTERDQAYATALRALASSPVDFLVGGGFALGLYLPAWRGPKDLDVFVRPRDARAALERLAHAGFAVDLLDPAWLGKARANGALVDIIFCSYNGLFQVEDDWFERARPAALLGVSIKVMSPEEMVLSKSFVAARDRFDGADIAWMIRVYGRDLDWDLIERSMAPHWQVLLWQLVHCLYVFPATREVIPAALVERLAARQLVELGRRADPVACLGPMLDPLAYLEALRSPGAVDPRPRHDLTGPPPDATEGAAAPTGEASADERP